MNLVLLPDILSHGEHLLVRLIDPLALGAHASISLEGLGSLANRHHGRLGRHDRLGKGLHRATLPSDVAVEVLSLEKIRGEGVDRVEQVAERDICLLRRASEARKAVDLDQDGPLAIELLRDRFERALQRPIKDRLALELGKGLFNRIQLVRHGPSLLEGRQLEERVVNPIVYFDLGQPPPELIHRGSVSSRRCGAKQVVLFLLCHGGAKNIGDGSWIGEGVPGTSAVRLAKVDGRERVSRLVLLGFGLGSSGLGGDQSSCFCSCNRICLGLGLSVGFRFCLRLEPGRLSCGDG